MSSLTQMSAFAPLGLFIWPAVPEFGGPRSLHLKQRNLKMPCHGCARVRSAVRKIPLSLCRLAFFFLMEFAQPGFAQTTPPLNFENNYFVTGDYVVAGVGLRGLGVNGFATKQFTMPDANSVPSTGVPSGADIVAAFLYWGAVESSQTAFAGQNGFFRPVFLGGPSKGYPI